MKIILILGGIILVLILIIIILAMFLKKKNNKIKNLETDLAGLQENLVSVKGLYEKLKATLDEKEELHEEVHNNPDLSDAAGKLQDNKPKRTRKS